MPSQLTYLKINRFRHVRPGSVIEFKPQFNVVVGRNGAGKTTLLNLVSALLSSNFREFVREEFSLEFQARDDDHDVVLDGAVENKLVNNQPALWFSGRLEPRGTGRQRREQRAENRSSPRAVLQSTPEA